jgi:hypothetical protein
VLTWIDAQRLEWVARHDRLTEHLRRLDQERS